MADLDLDLSDLDEILKAPSTKAPKRGAKASKGKPSNPNPRRKPEPFRELKAPPIRQPARGWAAIPPQALAREHFRAQALETATYRPEHMLGQFPPIGLHGPSIHSL